MKYTRIGFLVLFIVSFGIASTPNDNIAPADWDNAKKAYILQLSVNNPGVKTSAANFIRKYNIVEAADALKEILVCDNCDAVKVSAALALIQISGEDGLKAIKSAMLTEESDLIVAFYTAILHADAEKNEAPISKN
ncbi:MAG: hypothetical protein WCW35_01635 [Bacteroidota bacterium]